MVLTPCQATEVPAHFLSKASVRPGETKLLDAQYHLVSPGTKGKT